MECRKELEGARQSASIHSIPTSTSITEDDLQTPLTSGTEDDLRTPFTAEAEYDLQTTLTQSIPSGHSTVGGDATTSISAARPLHLRNYRPNRATKRAKKRAEKAGGIAQIEESGGSSSALKEYLDTHATYFSLLQRKASLYALCGILTQSHSNAFMPCSSVFPFWKKMILRFEYLYKEPYSTANGCCREQSSVSVLQKASNNKAFEELKEMKIVLQKKISLGVERAKEFTKAKDQQGADHIEKLQVLV
ncbi:uncharacterized protein A4U43_C10F7090 [Asparagus officinalis]|uniref:Uncharacterized protein n=1 Tax=Asparagus officinalis TaxID=4686 RepID=A0A5P1E308_ASPOF|nr:uncharacterized protein A4U43_C10F7090 [Asparagus officinalis]